MKPMRLARVAGVLILCALLLGTTFVVIVGEAGKPPRTCQSIIVNFFISGGNGKFYFNGKVAVNGQITTYSWRCGQTFPMYVLSSQINAGWKFSQWISTSRSYIDRPTDMGTATNPVQLSPGGNGPLALTMVLNQTAASNWAGYVYEIKQTGIQKASMAALGWLPTTASVQPGQSSEEIVSFWVGIGGVNGNNPYESIWQAGIDLLYCPASTATWDGECYFVGAAGLWFVWWWENFPSPPVLIQYCPFATCKGDSIFLQTDYVPAGGNAWANITDSTHTSYGFRQACGPYIGYPRCPYAITATLDSGEAIVEAPGYWYFQTPVFDRFQFAGESLDLWIGGVMYIIQNFQGWEMFWAGHTFTGLYTLYLYPSIFPPASSTFQVTTQRH